MKKITRKWILAAIFAVLFCVPEAAYARVTFGGTDTGTGSTTEEISMPKLTGLKADAAAADSITIAWTPDQDHSAIQIAYSDTDKTPEFPTNQEWITPNDQNNPTVKIEKLTPDTVYYIRIRSVKIESAFPRVGLDLYFGDPSDVIQVKTLSENDADDDPTAVSETSDETSSAAADTSAQASSAAADTSAQGSAAAPEISSGNSSAPEVITVGSCSYTIIGKTAAVVSVKSKAAAKITIPAKVTIKKKSLPVTSISPNAFKGMKKLTTVTIGKNVKKIGKNAFYGCKKLKKIVIKTSSLKTVGANAFKGIHAKAVITVPKKKVAVYTKLLKKKGIGKKVKITK